MSQIDVLSVGDVVTDAFIRIPDNSAHTFTNEHGAWLAVPFAAKVPIEQAEIKEAEGNAANASVSFARLGLESGLVSNVGNDQYGRDIIASLHRNKVDTRYIHINHNKVSNYNYILWYKDDRTVFTRHELYNYKWPVIHTDDLPKWLYFSSVSKNTLPFHDDLADWLEEKPDIKLAFQPGSFQMEEGARRLKRIYKRCEVLLLNRQEAAIVGGGDGKNVHDLFDKLHALGPKIVIITDGPKGAYASSDQGRFFIPVFPDVAPPLERTGAGDAFSSTIVAALIKGLPLEEALKWGPINSMNVVQHVGTQDGLLTEAQLVSMLKSAPDWYHPNPM